MLVLLDFLHLVATKHLSPFLCLFWPDTAEQVFRLSNSMTRPDGIRRPFVGDRKRIHAELGVYGLCRVWHVRRDDGGKKVDKVESQANDSRTFGRFVLFEAVVELIRLEKSIALLGDVEDCGQGTAQIDGVEFLDVLRQKLIDVFFPNSEGRLIVLDPYWNDVVIVPRVDEFQHAADEIAEILQEQVVVAANEGIPGELTVARLWPLGKEIEAPYIGWNASLLSRVPENPNTSRFGKLAALVYEVVRRGQVMQFCPDVSSADLRSREHDGVKNNVVLADELMQLDMLRVSPPFLLFLGVVGCDGHIANASVKSRVDDLVFVGRERYLCSPFHVPSDAAWLQSLLQPGRSNNLAIAGPSALLGGSSKEGFDLRLQLIQLQENEAKSTRGAVPMTYHRRTRC